tara:strand:- start:594 stop:1046 length:453 start_codon:yes stop_codon:yes gene_type:complete
MLIKQTMGISISKYNLEEICINCNEIAKKIKKMDRDFNRIDIVKNTDTETIYEAYIISLDDNKITIYCPELKFCDRIFLFDNKLSEMMNVEKYNDNILITNKQTEESIELKLYQKIKVKMIGILANVSIKNKLIVKILEPEIDLILKSNN